MLARCRCDDFDAGRGAEWRGNLRERGKEGMGELRIAQEMALSKCGEVTMR